MKTITRKEYAQIRKSIYKDYIKSKRKNDKLIKKIKRLVQNHKAKSIPIDIDYEAGL